MRKRKQTNRKMTKTFSGGHMNGQRACNNAQAHLELGKHKLKEQ